MSWLQLRLDCAPAQVEPLEAMLLGSGAVGATALSIANAKSAIGPVEAFFLGVLCNVLVCLAVWLCLGAHSTVDKIAAIKELAIQ